jgi:hypothetical protein
MAGLSFGNIRKVEEGQEPDLDFSDLPQPKQAAGNKQYNDKGELIRIEHDDGSVTISIDGKSIDPDAKKEPTGWFDNLVDDIDEGELSMIAEDLMRGIDDDIQSRQEWVEDRAQGIKLLGLKIELPGLQGAADGAPVEGMSKIRHPLLLEAVLRFQANARSEMLPVDGPVKIRNDNNSANLQEDQLGDALESDMNHYLTAVAKEYYPDTDRMLFMLGFGGTAFKKVYYCPLRNRPVSETVDADDLIVNNSATDLSNAKRITHRIMMRPSVVKRMQIIGAYRDTDLSTPNMPNLDAVQMAKSAQQGISTDSFNQDDRDREIYECYCELDIRGYEHKHKRKVSGLEIPYRVTIDVSTKKILSVVRNYAEDDQELPVAKSTFVKYTFVPGMGFYDIGLLHILGNTTNAVTAAWREMLDAGMFANFPGFLMADTGGRQNTNIFRVPPGGAALVKTGGMPINQAIMPLPYKEAGAGLMNLVTNMAETGMRLGGTSEQAVGEGRADAPVGTTLAMIEQATKVLNSVHKRMHASQADEFQLLLECFKENPESFWQRIRKPAHPWDEQTFLQACNDYELIPQADPNTASHSQRIMKIAALMQLQAANPTLYDPIAINKAALKGIGWNNPEQFMAPPEAQGRMPPEMQQAIAQMQIKKQEADAKTMAVQSKAQAEQADTQTKMMLAQAQIAKMQQPDAQKDPADNQLKLAALENERNKLELQSRDVSMDAENRAADREARERVAYAGIVRDLIKDPQSAPIAEQMLDPKFVGELKEEG